jgi:histidinol-phosphate aminotransferase
LKPSSLARDSIKKLNPPSYRTLPPEIIRMNDNSNLFMSNPMAEKVADEFDFDMLSQYPSIFSDDLRAAIGKKYKIDPSQVIVGNGSDEMIDLAVKAYVNPKDRVAIPVPTFEMYSMYAKISGAQIIECPLRKKTFQLDVDLILSSDPKMVFLSSPNNPTGNSFKKQDIMRIVEESDAVVVLDEAYCDFSDGASCLEHSKKLGNLLVLKTLSKAYALPGLRVGFCIGSKDLIGPMAAANAPFRLNRFSEKVAIEAIADDEFVRKVAEMAREEREWVSSELKKIGATVYPSETNFLLFRPSVPVKKLIQELLKEGIAIRDCSNQPMLENCARVTFGRREINKKFIGSTKKVMEDLR